MALRRCLLPSALSLAVVTAGLAVQAPAAEAATLSPTWTRSFPGQFIESSPLAVDLDGGQKDILVGNHDGHLYALKGEDGQNVVGWPFNTGNGIDSSPSTADTNFDGTPEIFIGSGLAGGSDGALFGLTHTGAQRWRFDPVDPISNEIAMSSTPVIGDVNNDAVPDASGFSLGLISWSFSENGIINNGWPFASDDSTHASPAIADVDGDGVGDYINGSESAAGGPVDVRGGVLRAIRGNGSVIWERKFDEINRSGPAVGDVTGDGIPEVIIGTGDYYIRQPGGSTDVNKLSAFTLKGEPLWVRDLGAVTNATPALADLNGDGRRDVIYGTWEGPQGGKIWAFDGPSGNPLPGWNGLQTQNIMLGQLTTADVNNDGGQDVFATTGAGLWIYSGKTGAELYNAQVGQTSFQNSTLITDLDNNGDLEFVVAGYRGSAGFAARYDLPSSAVFGSNGWHQYGYDNRRTNSLKPTPIGQNLCAPAPGDGYRMVAKDGGVFGYCNAPFFGSAGGKHLNQPVVGGVSRAGNDGYWLVARDGGVFAYGNAPFKGSAGNIRLNSPIVGMAATPDGEGYWLVAADGGIFTYGNAPFKGSAGGTRLNSPIVGMAAAADGDGYWLVAADGGVFAFGSAPFKDSMGGKRLNSPIVGMAATADGQGYWLVAADGGVFTFGNAPFHGALGSIRLNSPVLGITRERSGNGYRMVAADGGIFTFDASFLGSTGGVRLNQPVIAMMN